MKTLIKYPLILCLYCFLFSQGCKKNDYLDENLTSDLQVPANFESLESLLENSFVLNESPGMADASSDNYYLTYSSWLILSIKDRNTYLWEKDIYKGLGDVTDWEIPYEQVFVSNVVLEALTRIPKNAGNELRWNKIKGMALFFRSCAFYNLSQLFTSSYDSVSANTDLGLPLRLSDEVLEKSVRSTVQQTYNQMIADLKEAKTLLPVEMDALHPNRPSQPAALGLLAKVYLSMRQYEKAGTYADSCLQLHNKLLDYNTLNSTVLLPFKTGNSEIIFYSQCSKITNLMSVVSRGTFIDSFLYQSYDTNDLRRSLYFVNGNSGYPNIRGSYTGNLYPFSGIACDEMLLIRAECFARAGNTSAAMEDLNTLLAKRFITNTFIPYASASKDEALQLILTERRKELPFRNTRWTDLRRLNREGNNIILKRTLNGNEYELLPNQARYTLPIPPDVIALSGIQQNIR